MTLGNWDPTFSKIRALLASATTTIDFNTQVLSGVGALVFDSTIAAPLIQQPQRSGVGALAGGNLSIQAQPGQAQNGGAANNNGGSVVILGGVPGTGGGGAAGLNGGAVFGALAVAGSLGFDSKIPPVTIQPTDASGQIGINLIQKGTNNTYFQISNSANSWRSVYGYINGGATVLASQGTPVGFSVDAITSYVLFFAAGNVSGVLGVPLLQFNTSQLAPTINQANNTTNSATAATMTIQAANATGTTSNGGALNLTSGTGTTAAGAVSIQVGGTTRLQANATGIGAFGAAPVAKPTVTGAKGANAALGSLMTALAALGWVTDSTTA